ncbi:hypothetical protein GGR19_003347 [Croceicoccus naphthovorans]|nr:hypothetical protein [Croceicoccus naphthovorans]
MLNANSNLRWKLAIKLDRHRPGNWQVCNPATQDRIGQLICGIRDISRPIDTQLRGLEQRLILARCPQGFFIANRLREYDLRLHQRGGKDTAYGPFHGNFSLDLRAEVRRQWRCIAASRPRIQKAQFAFRLCNQVRFVEGGNRAQKRD